MADGELDASSASSAFTGESEPSPGEPQSFDSTSGELSELDRRAETQVIALLANLGEVAIPNDIATRLDITLAELQRERQVAEAEVQIALATLADVAMPAEIAAGIDAALSHEQSMRAVPVPGAAESATTAATTSATVTPLTKSTARFTARRTEVNVQVPAGQRFTRNHATRPTQRTWGLVSAAAVALGVVVLATSQPWAPTAQENLSASGSQTSTAPTANIQTPRFAQPTETLVQVSRHSYHRSSLTREVAALAGTTEVLAQVAASEVPARWRNVAHCAEQEVAQSGQPAGVKIDLGWLDGTPSAVVLLPATMSKPATARVLQVTSGACSVAASTRLESTTH